MPTGVQTAYDSVLGRAGLTLGSVHNPRFDIGADWLIGWRNAQRFDRWVMDWGGSGGFDTWYADPARGRVELARPAGSWAIYRPGIEFGERMHRVERAREFIWLYFDIAGELPPLSARPYTLVIDRDDRMAEQVRAMARAQERGAPGDALAAHGHLLVVLGEVLSSASAASGDERQPWTLPGPRAEPSGLLAALDERVMRRPAKPPSRGELAAALRMSESSLSHRFRAETGMTVVERIRWLRVREAKARLARPGASVKEVAAELGFSSAFYFSRVFSEVAGVSPQEYLRRMR